MAMKMTAAEAAKLGLTEQKPAKKPKAQKKINPELFKAMAKAHCLPEPIPEYLFKEGRRWAFDWLFIDGWLRIVLEIEGVSPQGTRHQRIGGFIKDLEKYNEATIMGYRVIRCTPRQVENGEAFELVKRALGRQ